MNRKLFIPTERLVEIFEEMISCRRIDYADTDFPRMTDVWESLCDGVRWKVKIFRGDTSVDFPRKVGVLAFGDRVTVTADERLWHAAKHGPQRSNLTKLLNFTLGHELGHVALGHLRRGGVTMNFQLFADDRGMLANTPPTVEELEANFAAVFCQCGVALLDPVSQAEDLAHRSFSDPYYVDKAQRIVQSKQFLKIFNRQRPILERVVL